MKKKIVLAVCIVILVLSLVCGIMCAWECDVCKYYWDIEKVISMKTEYSQNFEGFLLMLFSSIFSFIITICSCFTLLHLFKEGYAQKKAIYQEDTTSKDGELQM